LLKKECVVGVGLCCCWVFVVVIIVILECESSLCLRGFLESGEGLIVQRELGFVAS